MSGSFDSMDDCQLIARFCAGDKGAGDVLYVRHEPKLLIFIKGLLHEQGSGGELAQDIAQEVWIALISADFKLLKRYDAGQASFHTYLEEIARDLMQRRWRAAACGSRREVPLETRDWPDPGANDGLVLAELAEYREDLTPQENRCLRENLMREEKQSKEPPISGANERVLKHRLRLKWRAHFDTR